MYTFAIYIYSLLVRIASAFNPKAKKMVCGQAETFKKLAKNIQINERYIWFHASSLGEFEQGRPLIERVRAQYPNYKILLTFFSPSGYEVRKDYAGADIVCYLPFDTKRNARKFVNMVKPEKVFFIKYEFWKNYLYELKRRGIATYSVSSIFRENQIFFRWYGKSYANVLQCFSYFFVQNESSFKLLKSRGIDCVSVVGDTRFDRVLDIRNEAKNLPLVESFVTIKKEKKSKILVCGSTWAPDEDIIIPYFNKHPELQLILAPHVVSEEHLKEIEGKLARKSVRYTKVNEAGIGEADCLILDCYGLLSSIYRYADMAYVGGGFGVGIHNLPEAAVYGVPVVVGPNNEKFREARALIKCGGCFEIDGALAFEKVMTTFLTDDVKLSDAGKAAGEYIKSNVGAADAVFDAVFRKRK